MSTTARTQYSYADGLANTIRPTALVYPNGRTLTYDYGAANSQGDRLSRIASLIDDDGTTHLVDYTFLGVKSFVEADRPQPKVTWSIITDQGGVDPDTGDIYRGLDRFGRVKDNQWFGYGSGSNVDLDRIQYGYDRASNRIWRKNPVATSYGKEFDEIYTYDGVHRLKQMARGTLNGSQTALTSSTFGQCWTLDSTGNWSGFRQADSNATSWDLIQSRSANPVNEITGITNPLGSTWAQPAYSPAGNITTIPQPNDPTQSYTGTYDAWNRLVKLVDTLSSDTVSEYQYDAAKRHIVQKSYTSGTLSETRHFYYTAQWQAIEERLGTSPDSAAADRQFVWGLRYIDDLILRDRSISGGSLNERLYATQDANWNLTALCNSSGSVVERYAYSAYGVPQFRTASFAPTSSSYAIEYLYCTYRFDQLTALYPIRHRVYHPILGTWTTRDPLFTGMVGIAIRMHNRISGFIRDATFSLSFYTYCLGSPLISTDSSGLICECGEETHCALYAILAACLFGAFAANLADDMTNKWASLNRGTSVHNNKYDAYRHCVWSCLIAQVCGDAFATAITDVHEMCDLNPASGLCMDLYNIFAGRTIAKHTRT